MTDKRKMPVEGYQARPKGTGKPGFTQGYQAKPSQAKPPNPAQLPKGAISGVIVPKSTATK